MNNESVLENLGIYEGGNAAYALRRALYEHASDDTDPWRHIHWQTPECIAKTNNHKFETNMRQPSY